MTDTRALLTANAVTGTHVASPSGAQVLDEFFKNDPDVLKTYAIDYEVAFKFQNDLAWAGLKGMLFAPPSCVTVPCCMVGQKCFGEDNIRDRVYAQHLALTRDGIRYVVDQRKTACRLDCQTAGRISKTIPYDKMTDCDIEEPAGSSGPCCCLVPNVLTKVNVDTASSGNVNPQTGKMMHELQIEGLCDANQFKRDVWAMKRGEVVDGVDGTVAPMAVSMARGDAAAGGGKAGAVGHGPMPTADARVLAPLLEQQVSLLQTLVAEQKKTNELLEKAGQKE